MSNSLGRYAASQKQERTSTPQSRKTPGRNDEVKNNAGGFTFKVDDRTRLERFLILGTDKGTFYTKERRFTKDNVQFVKDMIQRSERLVVDTAIDVSENGRAAKNSPALFTIAVVMTEGQDKAYARAAVQKIVRTSTHLFEYSKYIDSFGGWGRAKRRSVAEWYESKSIDSLAYQAVKYRQRDGWTHRDLFRLAHPKGVDQNVGNFILGKDEKTAAGSVELPESIRGFKFAQEAETLSEILSVLGEYKNLPWEAIPTQFHKEEKVWKALFYNGALGQTALLRNVKRFAKMGMFKDMVFAADVAKSLSDKEQIRKGRVHPVAYLNALFIYTKGDIVAGGWRVNRNRDWDVNPKIAGALEKGFYNAFGNVEAANKRTMVSIDTSASMTWQAPAGLVGLDCREAAAAMAMVLVRSEPYVMVNAFSTSLRDAGISETDDLDTVMRKIDAMPAGGTDCAQPMLYATANNIKVDTFVVITDNETWAGYIKPFQALKEYRQKTGINARLVVIGMEGNEFTIADPTDSGMLDVCGFDANAPGVIADFSAGRI